MTTASRMTDQDQVEVVTSHFVFIRDKYFSR